MMRSSLNPDLGRLLFGPIPRRPRQACWALFTWGTFIAIGGLVILTSAWNHQPQRPGDDVPILLWILIIFFTTVGFVSLISAFALGRGRGWAKTAGMIVLAPAALSFPVGTGIAFWGYYFLYFNGDVDAYLRKMQSSHPTIHAHDPVARAMRK